MVTTDHDIYKNILINGVDGYLTRQNSVSFAKDIIKLLRDKMLSEKLSKNAKIKSKQFSS